jgi:(4S)-4-hydroxy-5-phosphonooxypentane-2,3-dione isomerase
MEGKTLYHIAVQFDVPGARRADFIAAALEDGRESLASEPGTKRYELVTDSENPNRFYLYEVYESPAAFEEHRAGEPCTRFFELIEGYAKGPTWLIKGNVVDEATIF